MMKICAGVVCLICSIICSCSGVTESQSLAAVPWAPALSGTLGGNESSNVVNHPEIGNVAYVDHIGQNFMFRGSLPSVTNQVTGALTFDYEGLVAALRDASKTAGLTLPSQFYVVDVNLLHIFDKKGDLPRIRAEQIYFDANPTHGKFVSMDTLGIAAVVSSTPQFQSYLESGFALFSDPIIDRVDTLRNWLQLDNSSPTFNTTLPIVLYVHCYGGCDRTGEVIGSYSLRYLGKTWQDVNTDNHGHCGRPFGCDNYNATQWYCYWLAKNVSTLSGLDCSASLGCT